MLSHLEHEDIEAKQRLHQRNLAVMDSLTECKFHLPARNNPNILPVHTAPRFLETISILKTRNESISILLLFHLVLRLLFFSLLAKRF